MMEDVGLGMGQAGVQQRVRLEERLLIILLTTIKRFIISYSNK